MKKLTKILAIAILIILLLTVCYFKTRGNGKLIATLTSVEGTTTYEMNFNGATVAEGSHSGLSFAFQEGDTQIYFDIPATEKFGIWEIYNHPDRTYENYTEELPLTITDEDYIGMKDAFGNDLSGDLSMGNTYFNDFEITINSIKIKDEKLWMAGSFAGKTEDNEINGTFNIIDGFISLMMVD
ncbi:MAG: hypothetical protein WCT46_03970 [Candidatus Gracilibacteria bacterium]|jgi:hypothetical protein